MRRLKFSMLILLVMITLGGCSKSINLTDEETDMFAEYISKEVLERDKYYDQELLTQEYDEDEEEEETTSTAGTNQGVTNVGYVTSLNTEKKNSVATVDEILGTSSVSVSYRDAKLYDSYPEDGNNYFIIASSKGYQLLVVTFELKNTSGKDASYSKLTSNVSYSLKMENGSTYNPLLTLLVDDLQFVNKEIPAGKTQEGVLVFRIAENEVKTKGTLEIVSGTKGATLEIK